MVSPFPKDAVDVPVPAVVDAAFGDAMSHMQIVRSYELDKRYPLLFTFHESP